MRIVYILQGLEEMIAKATPDLLRGPLLRFFAYAGKLVRDAVRGRAPRDIGRLYESIGYLIDTAPMPLFVRIGPNIGGLTYITPVIADAMEFGTGTQRQGPGGSGRPHRPPSAALEESALRHGFPKGGGFLVARAIGRRGGLRGRHYLSRGLRDSLAGLKSLLRTLADAVGQAWKD